MTHTKRTFLLHRDREVPKFDLPDEIHAGPVVIPAIYVRLAGVGAFFGLLALISRVLG